jgi:hypothetical protein
MKIPKRILNKTNIDLSTKSRINAVESTKELATNFLNDPESEQRKSQSLCIFCYYRKGRLASQAMCSTECAICNEEMVFGSTAVDALCENCAKVNNLCKQCAADIDLSYRKKPRHFEHQKKT